LLCYWISSKKAHISGSTTRRESRGETIDTEKANTLTLNLLEKAPAYNRWIFEKIRPWLGKKILEVGCGIGNLTGLLLNHGETNVSDVNEDYLQAVKNKFRGHLNLKELLPWDIRQGCPKNPGISIDTIVCSNVLEHVEDDDAVLKNFYQLLPVGGRLIVLVPALKMLYNILDRELGHFRRYNKKELIQKLTLNSYKISYLSFFNFFGILGWFVNGTLLRRRFLPTRQIMIFNKMVPFLIGAEKIIPLFVGQSLIAVSEKYNGKV
jgi:2-polyprenyl-3-methyl-5-hydroxy-6-metoxy-1,4-benzoquinol methylase